LFLDFDGVDIVFPVICARLSTSFPRIAFVKAVVPSLLFVCFDNGETRQYDCVALQKKESFRLLNCPAFFQSVHVDTGGYGAGWSDDLDLSEAEIWLNGREPG